MNNNAHAELVEGVSSKTNKPYAYILFSINGVNVGKLWIKLTEIDYYKKIIK